MHLYEIQFAWFFSGANQLDYERMVSSIRQLSKKQFLSPATYIPLPPMAPPEIPRAQLQTQDNSSRFTISLNRADYFISSTNAEVDKNQIELFFNEVISFSEFLLSSTGIIRLALVGRIYKSSTEPANEIATSFLKSKFNNLQDASVKFVERYVADKFTYNDSYQFDQGIKLDTQQKILVITRDINTAHEVPINVNKEIVRDFSALARERLEFKYINEVMGG